MGDHTFSSEFPSLVVTGDAHELVLCGEIDMESAHVLRDAMSIAAGNDGHGVTLVMDRVSFIDSSGLRVLVAFHRHGHEITITRPSRTVRRVLEMSGTIDLFTIDRETDGEVAS